MEIVILIDRKLLKIDVSNELTLSEIIEELKCASVIEVDNYIAKARTIDMVLKKNVRLKGLDIYENEIIEVIKYD